MRIESIILCGILALGCGCKKEAEPVERYKVFSATWENDVWSDQGAVKVPQKKLIKLDSATGRVWYWDSLQTAFTNGHNSSLTEQWVEMDKTIVK